MIGLLGGAFDPVHNGHLRAALDAIEVLDLDALRLMPLADPVHRAPPVASPERRLRMLDAAIQGEPRLRVDDRELRRGGPSYSVFSLRELRAEVGPERPLCLLIGRDAFRGFLTWREPQEILRLAHLVVLDRPDDDPDLDAELHALVQARQTTTAELRATPAGRIHPLATTRLEISSSDLRARIKAGRSLRYLVPDAVLGVLAAESPYR